MTVIAVKGRTMAADSWASAVGMHWPIAFPKIRRGRGGLIGTSGASRDCWRVQQWFLIGEDPHDKPRDLKTGDEGVTALILRPDGSLWCIDETLAPWPTEGLGTVGYTAACAFTEGAMRAGLSAEAAVRLAIKHCTHIGGDVQVESIESLQ